jgi:hypothetical protein
MRFKKDLLPCFMSVIAVLCFVILAPVFADMKKIDETELARTNASVTGKSIKNRINCVEKNGVCEETKQDRVNTDKVAAVSYPAVINTTEAIIDKSMNINGNEVFQFGMSGTYSNKVSGGIITSVQSH